MDGIRAAANAIGGGSSDNSGVQVESEIVAGDKDSSSDVQMGDRQDADTIVNNVTEIPMYIIFLLVLFWSLPTPRRMFNYLRSKIRGRQ